MRHRPARANALLAALLASLALLASVSPPALAQPEPRTLVFVVASVDGLAAPRTAFDGVDVIGAATSAGDAYNRFQRAYDLRRGSGAPVELTLEVALAGRQLTAWATPRVVDASGPDARELNVTFLLLVDAGPGASPLQRFRLVDDAVAQPMTGGANENGTARGVEFALPTELDLARVGLVASVSASNATALHRAGEVLQSALWLASSGSDPVVQREKAVLVRHETGPACAACVASDEALGLLVSQNGYPVDVGARGESYLVPPRPLAYVGAVAGLALGVALARRRA